MKHKYECNPTEDVFPHQSIGQKAFVTGRGSCVEPWSKDTCPINAHEALCFSSWCGYGTGYGDNSSTEGVYGRERLTLTPYDVIDNFLFGCGTNNRGNFHESEEDGILGLSQHPISIVQQTAKKHHQVFSYCIPSKPSFSGFLRFGGGGRKSLVHTPITKYKNDSTFYGINLIGISVGGKKLSMPSSVFTKTGSIIDSGTDITRLKPEIYKPLRDAYRKAMSRYLLVDPKDISQDLSLLDTCHFLGHQKSFKIPKVSFLLSGGVAVDIPTFGIAWQIHPLVVCFPISDKDVDDGPMIWGNYQQKTLEVVYDVGKRKIGLGYGACK
ncbi:hypothetical protein L6164_028924 [Bauhinia variegata]|uniref:Uncharacterized protein n=1 Tax=Bauhinia variegata TaxID=167791 RepID=A0ACB9L8Z9_BAUVA|nr:hypothetical protein L6164_028924 [Bauhinia variegata]